MPAVDVVVHLFPAAGPSGFPEFRDEILGLFERLVRREGGEGRARR